MSMVSTKDVNRFRHVCRRKSGIAMIQAVRKRKRGVSWLVKQFSCPEMYLELWIAHESERNEITALDDTSCILQK
jgi:hypothetical protein